MILYLKETVLSIMQQKIVFWLSFDSIARFCSKFQLFLCSTKNLNIWKKLYEHFDENDWIY